MKVTVMREAGYGEALLGLSLSFYDHKEPLMRWWCSEGKIARAQHRAELLAHKPGGHNKFLESMQVWVLVQATRGFWQEFDTYRAGVTKQSASTMHTLDKRPVTAKDFEIGTSPAIIAAFNECLKEYKDSESPFYKDITRLKDNLPEGWLQERLVCTNYKVLQHIASQRQKHRYKHWRTFLEELKQKLKFPEFLDREYFLQQEEEQTAEKIHG
jgi:hypothetical protein